MERSKWVLWALVAVAAVVIIWRVGFVVPSDLATIERDVGAEPSPVAASPNEAVGETGAAGGEPNSPADANAAAEPNGPDGVAEPNRPPEPNEPAQATPGDQEEPSAASEDDKTEPAESATPEDPNNPMEAVNLKDVEMKNIIEKIAKWTGKTVIPHEEAMKHKITIYAPEKLPRKKALEKIYSALRLKGCVVEEVDDTIFLKPLAGAKVGMFPTVGPDEPLAAFENKDQIVQKFFRLTTYPAAQMGEIVQPLVGEYGHVSADATTGMLLVIDTVGNLMRIENIIDQFDVPEAGKAVTDVIEVRYGDPAEIVQVLRLLLGEPPVSRGRGRSSPGGRVSSPRPGPSSRPSGQGSGGSKEAKASSVTVAGTEIPIILIPEPRRKWIIVSGSAEDIKQVKEWVAKLDVAEPVKSDYETVAIAYADPREVANRIENAFAQMPGMELRPSVLVQPLEQSRQIMIFGRADLREMIKQMIVEVDIPPGTFETKHFQLKHADPEQIKDNIDSLYGQNAPTSGSGMFYYYYYGPGRNARSTDTVKAIAFPMMRQVTVIASPENMRKIEKQIDEWDVPLDVKSMKPLIIELHNSDPVRMTELLTRLFSEEQESSAASFIRWYFYDDMGDQRQKIVGPLYGQLTFEDVPGTKKIIVISKIPEAYDVIENLIYDLDREEMAETPHVVQIKYADTEDLAERLNAMFNEPGTTATIRRTTQGIGQYSMDESEGNQNQGNTRNASNNTNNQSNPGEYTPWWSRAVRQRLEEEPLSNVIGRVRFIPDPRSKSILVLAPPEFQSSLAETIRELDVPGKQVMVKAVVVEVDHQDLTSLGLQLSSNPLEAFRVGEDAITAVSQLAFLEERGSATIEVGTSITALLDFLIKKVNAQILNQQTLWTQDNEEASFFKGQAVAFQTSASVSDTGNRVTSSFEYKRVGMTLAVRPSITPERNVDMIVTVLLSDLTGDQINGQPVRRLMETTTNMLVEDGQTLMLGGILFQTDSKVERKIPLFGDLPLVGGAFRHNNITKANNELIVFITPHVIAEGEELPEETRQQIEEPTKRLEQIEGNLNQMSQELEETLKKE